MPTRRRVDPSDVHRFLGEAQSSARESWLSLVRQRNSGRDLNSLGYIGCATRHDKGET